MSKPNTKYAKEKKRLKQKLRKAIAHLRKVKAPPVHKEDVVEFVEYDETTGLPEYRVTHTAGSVRTNQGATMNALDLTNKICLLREKLDILMFEDAEHLLDLAHAEAVVMNKKWSAANGGVFVAAA